MVGATDVDTFYFGDGTYTVKDNDRITADNEYSIKIVHISWALAGDTTPKVTLTFNEAYSTTLFEGESGEFTTGAAGGPKVLMVSINSVNTNDLTASVTIKSIFIPQEQPDIPLPESDSDEQNGATESPDPIIGDGTYKVKVGIGVKIISNSGYIIEIGDIYTSMRRFEGEVQDVDINVFDKNNQLVSGRIIGTPIYADASYHDLGLTIDVQEITGDEVTVTVSSSLPVYFNPGWNLFSVPLSWNSATDNCEDDATCYGSGPNGLMVLENTCGDLETLKIWTWDAENNQYRKSLPYPLSGYWVKMDKECIIRFGGSTINLDNLPLQSGWNMIGGPTKAVEIDDIKNNCNVVNGPWRYSFNQYEEFEFLGGGQGYFVKVANACQLGKPNPGISSSCIAGAPITCADIRADASAKTLSFMLGAAAQSANIGNLEISIPKSSGCTSPASSVISVVSAPSSKIWTDCTKFTTGEQLEGSLTVDYKLQGSTESHTSKVQFSAGIE